MSCTIFGGAGLVGWCGRWAGRFADGAGFSWLERGGKGKGKEGGMKVRGMSLLRGSYDMGIQSWG